MLGKKNYIFLFYKYHHKTNDEFVTFELIEMKHYLNIAFHVQISINETTWPKTNTTNYKNVLLNPSTKYSNKHQIKYTAKIFIPITQFPLTKTIKQTNRNTNKLHLTDPHTTKQTNGIHQNSIRRSRGHRQR